MPCPAEPLLRARVILVPTGRLELPRLSPLPPQDSVSTNFTTSACQRFRTVDSHRQFRRAWSWPTAVSLSPIAAISVFLPPSNSAPQVLAGAVDAGAGDCGRSPAFGPSPAPWAPTPCCIRSSAAPVIGREVGQARGSTERKRWRASRSFATENSPSPRRRTGCPTQPLPNAAPMSAPLPCCSRTKPINATAIRKWTPISNCFPDHPCSSLRRAPPPTQPAPCHAASS